MPRVRVSRAWLHLILRLQIPTLEANLEYEQAKLATLENANLIADSEAKIKELEVGKGMPVCSVAC